MGGVAALLPEPAPEPEAADDDEEEEEDVVDDEGWDVPPKAAAAPGEAARVAMAFSRRKLLGCGGTGIQYERVHVSALTRSQSLGAVAAAADSGPWVYVTYGTTVLEAAASQGATRRDSATATPRANRRSKKNFTLPVPW